MRVSGYESPAGGFTSNYCYWREGGRKRRSLEGEKGWWGERKMGREREKGGAGEGVREGLARTRVEGEGIPVHCWWGYKSMWML